MIGRAGRRVIVASSMTSLALTLGACTVDSSGTDRPRSQQEDYEREGAVRYDLSTPPATAQQLGVKPGRTSGAFNRVGDEYWTYEVMLPGGKTFITQGFGHRVSVENGQGIGLGNTVLINGVSADVEAAAAELGEAVTLVGLDVQLVRDWTARARSSPAQDGDVQVIRGAPQGYLDVAVELRRQRLSDEVVMNWDFYWDPPVPDQGSAAVAPGPA